MKVTAFKGNCPNCFRATSHATDPTGDNEPHHGDFSICMPCGEWMVFDLRRGQRNTLRKPTPRERLEIESNPDCQLLRKRWLGSLHA